MDTLKSINGKSLELANYCYITFYMLNECMVMVATYEVFQCVFYIYFLEKGVMANALDLYTHE